MVDLTRVFQSTAVELPAETVESLKQAVTTVLHKLPELSFFSPQLREALDARDLETCKKIEHETFPACLYALREVTAHDEHVFVVLMRMFGFNDLQRTGQIFAFGSLFAVECILEYFRTSGASDEIAELNRMFNGNKNVLDFPSQSCDDINGDNAA